MKKVFLMITLLSLTNAMMVHPMDEVGTIAPSQRSTWSLKGIVKACCVGLLLLSGQSEAVTGYYPTKAQLIYCPDLPANTATCDYEYVLPNCKESHPYEKDFSCKQKAELICRYHLDDTRLDECAIRRTCWE